MQKKKMAENMYQVLPIMKYHIWRDESWKERTAIKGNINHERSCQSLSYTRGDTDMT